MISSKKALISVVVILLTGCSNTNKMTKNQPVKAQNNETEVNSLITYKNPTYNITLQLPKSWIFKERQHSTIGKPAINFFKNKPKTQKNEAKHVFGRTDQSYITIWPKGLGTELPSSQYEAFNKSDSQLNLSFTVNKAESKLLVLKDGSIWAYFIVPKDPPKGWSAYGFIYAQIKVKNGHRACYDEQTGTQVPIKECNFMEGDKVVRSGSLARDEAKEIIHILGTIDLETLKND